MFRSSDLWVMSPPRFHCATSLRRTCSWLTSICIYTSNMLFSLLVRRDHPSFLSDGILTYSKCNLFYLCKTDRSLLSCSLICPIRFAELDNPFQCDGLTPRVRTITIPSQSHRLPCHSWSGDELHLTLTQTVSILYYLATD